MLQPQISCFLFERVIFKMIFFNKEAFQEGNYNNCTDAPLPNNEKGEELSLNL